MARWQLAGTRGVNSRGDGMNGGHWEPIRNGTLLVLLEDWQQVLHRKDYPSLPHAAMFKMVGWRGSPPAPAEGTGSARGSHSVAC